MLSHESTAGRMSTKSDLTKNVQVSNFLSMAQTQLLEDQTQDLENSA